MLESVRLLRRTRKTLVCAHCGREIAPEEHGISDIPLNRPWKIERYHETCAAEAGRIDEDEFGRPLSGPRPGSGD
jgi:hypothetical protein